MSKAVIVTFQASIQGDANYQAVAPVNYILTNSPYLHTQSTLNLGTTIMTIPTQPALARYVRILPPVGSAITKTIYLNVVGTNGWAIDPANETWLSIPAAIIGGGPPTALLVVASGTEVVDWYWY